MYARSGDICERCGRARGAEWQHRKNRSQGGQWTADNGLHLCSPCHRYVHEHPAESAGCGWTVKRDQDPAAAAVFVRGHRWVYLTDFGTYSEYPPGGDVA